MKVVVTLLEIRKVGRKPTKVVAILPEIRTETRQKNQKEHDSSGWSLKLQKMGKQYRSVGIQWTSIIQVEKSEVERFNVNDYQIIIGQIRESKTSSKKVYAVLILLLGIEISRRNSVREFDRKILLQTRSIEDLYSKMCNYR